MPGPTYIDCDRIDLRTVEEEDADFLRRGVNHPAVRRYIGVFDGPYSAERYESELLERELTGDGATLLVCDGGDRVGSVALDPIDESRGWANLGAWIHPDHQGEGYATEACAGIIDYAFGERGLRRISAAVVAPNEASHVLCERLGFAHEGVRREDCVVDGEYVDQHYYGLLRREWDPEGVDAA